MVGPFQETSKKAPVMFADEAEKCLTEDGLLKTEVVLVVMEGDLSREVEKVEEDVVVLREEKMVGQVRGRRRRETAMGKILSASEKYPKVSCQGPTEENCSRHDVTQQTSERQALVGQ
jgi:hypothetical protein